MRIFFLRWFLVPLLPKPLIPLYDSARSFQLENALVLKCLLLPKPYLLIEAGSTSSEKPNAIWVEQNMPQVLTQACVTGVEGEIGKQAVTPQSIDNALQSLSNEPPKKFNIARIERVYHSKIHFV